MLSELFPALRMIAVLTVLTGLVYPGAVTALCQIFFRDQADGSLISRNGQIVGSSLLAQNFSKPEYFHPRPSAAGSAGFDPTASGGSNYGPTNQKLFDRVKAAAEQFRRENPTFQGSIPADALSASASGLDPHISIANASAQAERIAQTRGVELVAVERLIASETEQREWGFLGESRVNVLQLNLALDREFHKR